MDPRAPDQEPRGGRADDCALAEGMGEGAGEGGLRQGLKQHRGLSLQRYGVVHGTQVRTQSWAQTCSVILGQCLHSLGLIVLICEMSGVEEGLSGEGLRLPVIL